MANQKYPKMTTGRGIAIWPRINQPDTKFDPDGKYELTLAFDEDDATLQKIEAEATKLAEEKLEEIKADLIAKGKKAAAGKITLVNLVREEEDDETGEATGRKTIKATMKASGISKKTNKPWSRKPDVFNGAGKKLTVCPNVGSGSVCKMSVELFPYYAAAAKEVGCTFRLEGVQVIKLVEFGQRDAGGHGFGEEDDADDIEDTQEDSPPFDADEDEDEDDGL